ncbi:hypothetical protein ACTXT7_007042 [Hymenolepis weldensis]
MQVGQILGNFSSIKRERDELAICWLRTLAFILVLSVIISLGGVKTFREEINSILLDHCAFKLGAADDRVVPEL